MAAMFQAQTQNWEETQEKMSQLVLPIAGFCLYVVQNLMMNVFFFFSSPTCLIEIVPHVFIPILEELAFLAVENRILPMLLTRFRTIGLCLLAMFAIDADRKVCPHHAYPIKTHRS
jgi:hypothetical protein